MSSLGAEPDWISVGARRRPCRSVVQGDHPRLLC